MKLGDRSARACRKSKQDKIYTDVGAEACNKSVECIPLTAQSMQCRAQRSHYHTVCGFWKGSVSSKPGRKVWPAPAVFCNEAPPVPEARLQGQS
eukprot:6467132-Amphidinium_carterae.2